MISYCSANESLTVFWTNHGFGHCFLDTTASATTLSFIVFFGILQLAFYKKYASVVQHYRLPFSQLFGVQVVLNSVMPVIAVVRIVLQAVVFNPSHVIYGYMILSLVQALVAWPLVIILIMRERHYMLPTVPRKGHGLVLLFFWTLIFAIQNLLLLNIYSPEWFFQLKSTNDKIQFSIFVIEYIFAGLIFLIGLKAPGIPSIRHSDSFTRLYPPPDSSPSASEGIPLASGSPFKNLSKKITMLLPFIWPSKSILLQSFVILCVATLILGRVTNVYVPIYSKKIVDSLTISGTNSSVSYDGSKILLMGLGATQLIFRWDLILIYVGLKIVQGGGASGTGLLGTIRNILWIKVEQYTTRQVEVKFFAHLHNLSLRWHLQRKTGEVLRAMDRGTDSINNILNYLIFSILPTIADIIIAIVYLTAFFNGWFGLIVFITMVVYLVATFTITEWRTKYRRSMNQADNEQKQKAIDSLLNFETVKYYANERFETARYKDSINRYQKEEWKVTISMCILNMAQLVIINIGLLVGSLLCVHMIVHGDDGFTVGDYILFTSYLLQLYGPLNFFGTYYRLLQRSFIDMENMLDLFKEEQEVVDVPGATALQVKNGAIEFRDVSFSYVPEREILKNISFIVPPGTTAALVGPTGSGKTSILRLLFRFYDPSSGEIFIDGQCIQQVTQASLRQSVGVVPQDTVLFNDSIHYNIKYGRISAGDDDMIRAAQAACIHDKIMTFPDLYETKVGERGLKLSGGEKQRVAIARTVLKNPTVILLDEATSSLDTHTERQIQASLEELCRNRTSIIVAHRLSTIVNADQILVLKDGVIAESGSHEDLLSKGGLYAAMWNEQLKSNNAKNADKSDSNGTDESGEGQGQDQGNDVPTVPASGDGNSTHIIKT